MTAVISAILVDDEERSRRVLRNLLKNYFPEVNIVGEAADVEEAYNLVNTVKPNLVFLDIQMPGGDGFWLLKRWDELPFDVIFVTSFDQHAIEAIKYSALYYLLKPIQVHELKMALGKALTSAERRRANQLQIVSLLDNLDASADDKKVAVHIQDKVRLLNVKQIMYIEVDDHYSNIKMLNGEKFTAAKSLNYFEELLSANKDFMRIHKSSLINVGYIKEYSKGEPCILTMVDGKQFEVARRKKQEILERLKDKL
jgi:two-component system LytT family response regulator